MSKRVIVICVLMCLAGLGFGFPLAGLLVSGVAGQLLGMVMMAFFLAGFMLLPAGIGMLLGYRAARKVAMAPLMAGYAASAALLASPLIPGFQTTGLIQGPRACAALALTLLGIVLLLHWTLYSPSFEEHLS